MRLDKLCVRATATVSVPATVPQNAFLVDPSFPGVSFELNTFSLYAQTSPTDASANQYSINLISEVFKRTGARPLIRVGGNTGDSTLWNENLSVPVSPAPGTTETGNLTIGPKFWPLTQLLSPTDTLWMPQISYTDTNYEDANQAAQSMMSGIGAHNLGAIEIGNEPNEYGGHTGPSATNAQYFATRFQEIAANITAAANIPNSVKFAGPDLASEDIHPTDWSQQELFENTTFDATGNIKYGTDHWYRCIGESCTIPDLISHASTVADTAKHIKPVVEFFHSYKGGEVKYFLDEINLQTGGTINATMSFSFGTALYGTDFMMYLMSLGVAAVNWEQVYNSNQNVWQPSDSSTLAAQTKNIYYSLITAAEFIGTGGKTKVVEVTPGNNDGTTFSSYVAYEGDKPARVALCNLNYWDTSLSTSRPTTTVQIDGVPSTVKSVTVKYLTNPGGAAQNADSTTFGGSQWTYSSQGKEVAHVQSTTITVSVSGGKAEIPVPDSAVAIVHL